MALIHGCGLAHVNIKNNKILCKKLADGTIQCRITDLGSALREGEYAFMLITNRPWTELWGVTQSLLVQPFLRYRRAAGTLAASSLS